MVSSQEPCMAPTQPLITPPKAILYFIETSYILTSKIPIFLVINGTEEFRLAAINKEREQTKLKSSIVTTDQIQQLGTFYPAEPEH